MDFKKLSKINDSNKSTRSLIKDALSFPWINASLVYASSDEEAERLAKEAYPEKFESIEQTETRDKNGNILYKVKIKDDEERFALVKHYTNGANVSFVNDFDTCAFTILNGKRYDWLVDMPSMDICETVLESKGGEFVDEDHMSWTEIQSDEKLGGAVEADDDEFSDFCDSLSRFERESRRRE